MKTSNGWGVYKAAWQPDSVQAPVRSYSSLRPPTAVWDGKGMPMGSEKGEGKDRTGELGYEKGEGAACGQ